VASLSVSTPISRMPASAVAAYGTLVAGAARQVSRALGYRSPVPG
jgi:DNA-binding IclR family transcriptional regulator